MATLNIPNSFTNGTPANANEVNSNFSAVKSFVEASLVQADGSVKAGTGAISDGAVTADKIGSGAVTEAKIGSGAVTEAKIGTGAVTSAKLADKVVTAAKIGVLTNTTAKTDSFTLALGDENTTILCDKATAMTVTVPLNSSVAFAVGTQISFVQLGAGQVTFAGAGGVTLNSDNSKKKILVRYGVASLIKTGTDTWVLFGQLTA